MFLMVMAMLNNLMILDGNMKRLLVFIEVAFVLSLASCSRDFLSPEPSPEPEPVKYVEVAVTVGLDTSAVQTKTYMTDSVAIGKVCWSVGDQILLSNSGIPGGTKSNALTAGDISNDGKSAKFKFKVEETDASKVQIRPSYFYYGDFGDPSYSGLGQGSDSPLVLSSTGVPTSVRFSATQTYAGNKCFADKANLSIGVLTNTTDTVCVLKNLFAILKVNVTLSGSGGNIDCVQLTNKNGKYLAGNFGINFDADYTPSFTHTSGGESFTIENIVPANVIVGSGSSFYFLVPPSSLLGDKGFNLIVYTRSGLYGGKNVVIQDTETIRGKKILQQNTVTKLDVSFSQSNIPVPGDQTANCYLIPATAGLHSIPAGYQGNGYQGNGNDKDVSAGSHPISDGAKAEIIWQTKLNGDNLTSTEIVSNPTYFTSNNKHYISFYCSGQEGNALVALKDANGTILWSWNLWVTSQNDITAIQAGKWLTKTEGGNIVQLMDRNLGALTANPDSCQSHGLGYEFGRKDPFMNSRFTKTSETQTAYASFASIFPPTAIFCTAENSSSAQGFDYTQSIKYPFVRNLLTSGYWSKDGDESWGTYVDSKAYKSLYDPCPVGWMVMDEQRFDTIKTGTGTGTNVPGTVNTAGEGYSLLLTENGHIDLPAAGLAQDRFNVVKVGSQVALWGGNYKEKPREEVKAYYIAISLNPNSTINTKEYHLSSENKYTTMPVRCQRVENGPEKPTTVNGVATKSSSVYESNTGYVSLDNLEEMIIE